VSDSGTVATRAPIVLYNPFPETSRMVRDDATPTDESALRAGAGTTQSVRESCRRLCSASRHRNAEFRGSLRWLYTPFWVWASARSWHSHVAQRSCSVCNLSQDFERVSLSTSPWLMPSTPPSPRTLGSASRLAEFITRSALGTSPASTHACTNSMGWISSRFQFGSFEFNRGFNRVLTATMVLNALAPSAGCVTARNAPTAASLVKTKYARSASSRVK
jgi:hypothetical protein